MSNPFLNNPSMVAIIIAERSSPLEKVESDYITAKRVFYRFTNTGEYITDINDVGSILTFKPKFILESTQPTNVTNYISISDNNIDWSNWSLFDINLNYTCRYFKFKIVMNSESVFNYPKITSFSYGVDKHKVIKSGQETIEIGGKAVSYGYTYENIPMLMISPLNDNLKYKVNTNKTDFIIQLFDKTSGVETNGDINWLSSG